MTVIQSTMENYFQHLGRLNNLEDMTTNNRLIRIARTQNIYHLIHLLLFTKRKLI